MLTKLHELSLVELMIETPRRFRAVPIKRGVESLLKVKTQNYEKLKRDSEVIVNAVGPAEDQRKKITSVEEMFVLIPRKEAVIKRQIEAIEKTQKSIDLVLSWKRFFYGKNVFDEHVRKVVGRGVHIRYVVEEPPTEKLRKQVLKEHEGSTFEVRFIPEKPKAIFGIYDQERLMILVDPLCDAPGESPTLWANNPSLSSLVQEHFEAIWKKAKDN